MRENNCCINVYFNLTINVLFIITETIFSNQALKMM